MNFETHIIETYEMFEQLKEYVASENFEFVAFDTETDSVIEKTAKIFGIGLCFVDEQAFYIPIRHNAEGEEKKSYWPATKEAEIYAWVFSVLKDRKTIGWNLIYDTLVFENNSGYDITPYIYSDGILQKHTLAEERPFGLKEVAVEYLGSWADKAQKAMHDSIHANGGSTTKANMEMWKCDTQILGEYCCWDVILTRKLFDIFEPRLKAEGLSDLFYKDEIMPLYKEVTIPMKRQGFAVDVPYFQKLKEDITEEIIRMEEKVQAAIAPEVSEFVKTTLEMEYPEKRTGNFPKHVAHIIGFQLPLNKKGGITLSKKELDKLPEPESEIHKDYLFWLRGSKADLPAYLAERTRRYWHKLDNQDSPYVFNLGSNNHLKWLFFEHLGEEPLSETDGGEPQVGAAFLDSISDNYPWVSLLIDYKKLQKLKGTYIEGILDRQIDGVIYTSMLQFGTTSGRYASQNPNLQNLPATKEEDSGMSPEVIKYVNSIRAGFIAPPGYKLVDADQSALEPRCFASVSGDANLQHIFHSGEDMYSSIAIRSFGVTDSSAFKKDKNYLGTLHPNLRKMVKVYCLAVAYGAGAGRIAGLLNISKQEAQKLIDDYLDAYPGLKNYIEECHFKAKTEGKVATRFGRVRHLPNVKAIYERHGAKLDDWKYIKRNGLEVTRYLFRNGLNNATNMPIQGLAANLMNRSLIAVARAFKKENINGYIALQVHDQLIAVVQEDQAERAAALVQYAMENTVKIEVPLIAEPKVANNLKDSH